MTIHQKFASDRLHFNNTHYALCKGLYFHPTLTILLFDIAIFMNKHYCFDSLC